MTTWSWTSVGEIASAPIDSDGNWSVSGNQVLPPSSERQTPPLTAPAKMVSPPGCIASACTAPLTGNVEF